MALSIFEIFKIGIGPSSSHTVGPMRAAELFLHRLDEEKLLMKSTRITCHLFGSLAMTGKGHGTDRALQWGFLGEKPESIDGAKMADYLKEITDSKKINFLRKKNLPFDAKTDLIFERGKSLPYHPNGMTFIAYENATEIYRRDYYSIGGGFVVSEETASKDSLNKDETKLPFAYESGDEILKHCQQNKISISELVIKNELQWAAPKEINQKILKIWQAMDDCIERGLHQEGILPGGLKVKRRAPEVFKNLEVRNKKHPYISDPLQVLDWVNLYALSVNEENAAGGKVVTAPTNGAAGIIPAVIKYYLNFCQGANLEGVQKFLLTAGAIGILYKMNASISGAEVGCQGEVGVACSMAAAGLTEALGGTAMQVENAAEIGMEHNLGLTCDPVGGLVQIPCIERNAMGAVKAINASRIALQGDGTHMVSLDKVIRTMRETGRDMQSKYKETSEGGLAVNVTEC